MTQRLQRHFREVHQVVGIAAGAVIHLGPVLPAQSLQNAGEGVGIAPIGHVVRVEGVGEDTINLSFDLYYQREWSWDDVSAYVTEAINGYFLELAQSWADQNEALVVRISQVESRLLGITGILDIANTKINGEAANCTLTLDHIPVLGTIEPGTIVISG